MRHSINTFLAGTLAAAIAATPALAADLVIGVGSEATTMDPHFYNLGPNTEITESVFDRLIHHDENLNAIPGIAESWTASDDGLTWTFKLRKDAKFHDGKPVTTADVTFSFDRLPKVENSPSSFQKYLRLFEKVAAIDAHTLRIKATIPSPNVLHDLEQIAIVPKHLGMASTEDYNNGKAMIGSGPYKYGEWKSGDRVVLTANKDYWGTKPQWDKVTIKTLSSNPARTAAILAGDVDVISFVPTVDIKRLKASKDVQVFQRAGNRLLYFGLDVVAKPTPMVRGSDGKPLGANPLADVRVRKALSKAINRDIIVDRIMDGVGLATGQAMASHFNGTNSNIKIEPYDPEGAKKLLAEAGYPNGFQLTVHGPNDRYPNDEKVVQAAAQMLTRAGIDASVETFPKSVYFGKASKRNFSMYLVGSSANSTLDMHTYVLNTWTPDKGLGPVNRGRYSNAKHDALLAEARVTLDPGKYADLMRQAGEIAFTQDQAMLPVLHFVNSWAARKGFVMHPQAGDQTRPMDISPAS